MLLTTPRLILRDFVPGDWEAVLAYQRDPRYLRFYEWESRTEEQVRAFVQMFVDQARSRPRVNYQLAVARKDNGRLIGNAGVRPGALGSPQAEIGYELAPDEWGQGFATEAMREVIRFGREELGVRRFTAWTVADNAASIRVLEKLGLSLEARLPAHQQYKGRTWDVLGFGMGPEDTD